MVFFPGYAPERAAQSLLNQVHVGLDEKPQCEQRPILVLAYAANKARRGIVCLGRLLVFEMYDRFVKHVRGEVAE